MICIGKLTHELKEN